MAAYTFFYNTVTCSFFFFIQYSSLDLVVFDYHEWKLNSCQKIIGQNLCSSLYWPSFHVIK